MKLAYEGVEGILQRNKFLAYLEAIFKTASVLRFNKTKNSVRKQFFHLSLIQSFYQKCTDLNKIRKAPQKIIRNWVTNIFSFININFKHVKTLLFVLIFSHHSQFVVVFILHSRFVFIFFSKATQCLYSVYSAKKLQSLH